MFSNRNTDIWYGKIRLEPEGDIVAGTYGTWRLIYTVGRYGIDSGGRMKLACRLSSDWGTPQFSDPEADNYVTVTTDGDARLAVSWEPKGYLRPFFKTITLGVYDGSLKEGDQVVITLGDTIGGSRGTRAQSFIESHFQFKFVVESFESGIFVALPSSPVLAIVSAEPHRLLVSAPSLLTVGEPLAATVKAEDRFGNLAGGYTGRVAFLPMTGLVAADAHTYQPDDGGVHRFEGLVFKTPGTYRLQVRDDAGCTAVSNPVRVTSEPPRHRIYWADIHGQTGETVGAGSVDEYFRFARDVAALDVTGHQGNDFQITRKLWAEIEHRTKEYHEPGRFVTFLGWEWSGNNPAGGDHNVYYPLSDTGMIHRSSHWQIPDKSDEENDRYPITELYKTLRSKSEPVLVIPHVGGRHCNLDFHDPDLEPALEITSVHGRFEWLLEDALRRGYKVGVVGNSDDHTCRPGAAYPTDHSFGVRGGLTGIQAAALTREEIFAAYKARRTYATTGARIFLSVTANGHPMGAEFTASRSPALQVEVSGTGPIDRVEIKRGSDVVYSYPPVRSADLDPQQLRILWGGARIPGRGRHTRWDGEISLSRGRITSAETVAFDAPTQGLTEVTEQKVAWISTTSGDVDGLVLRLDAPPDAALTFTSPVTSFSVRISDLAGGLVRHEVGGLDQHVEVSLMPRQAPPADVSFTFTDPEIRPGLNAYYVRVMQTDGEMAWSSPIYVRYEGPGR